MNNIEASPQWVMQATWEGKPTGQHASWNEEIEDMNTLGFRVVGPEEEIRSHCIACNTPYGFRGPIYMAKVPASWTLGVQAKHVSYPVYVHRAISPYPASVNIRKGIPLVRDREVYPNFEWQGSGSPLSWWDIEIMNKACKGYRLVLADEKLGVRDIYYINEATQKIQRLQDNPFIIWDPNRPAKDYDWPLFVKVMDIVGGRFVKIDSSKPAQLLASGISSESTTPIINQMLLNAWHLKLV